MTRQRMPLRSLPWMALVQVWIATVLISPLREPGAPWTLGYAVLSALGSLAGVVVLAFAARNCGRLWRLPQEEASWALVVASGVTAALMLVVATGPASIGVWRWESLMPGVLGAYLTVILVREVSRVLSRGKVAGESEDS